MVPDLVGLATDSGSSTISFIFLPTLFVHPFGRLPVGKRVGGVLVSAFDVCLWFDGDGFVNVVGCLSILFVSAAL